MTGRVRLMLHPLQVIGPDGVGRVAERRWLATADKSYKSNGRVNQCLLNGSLL